MGIYPQIAILCIFFTLTWAKRPNIVFIITDDQDQRLGSLDYMPLLKKHITDQGTRYKSHYCTIAICCPSRVSLWTGKAAHNTNVTDVVPPYGGYPKFVEQRLNTNYLPIWLQESGYNTYYTGKLFNSHSVLNYNDPVPGGWTGSDFLLDPYTYQYYNASMSRNGAAPVSYEGQYSNDLIATKVYGFLEDAIDDVEDKPFFLVAAPIGPHANVDFEMGFSSAVSAPRHAHLFNGYKIPRMKNFNPDTPSGVNWIARLPKLNETEIAYNDDFQRTRLQALQSVDEMVEGIVERLEAASLLDNTYIIYTSDNGYHISQHRLHPGKSCGFEEDINIPLIIRGPGVDPKKILKAVTSHTDLAPTIMKIAVGDHGLNHDFDGSPIPLTETSVGKKEHVNVEYWGRAFPEGAYGLPPIEFDIQGGIPLGYVNNTYKALRLIGEGYNLYYSVWCTNEKELYDLENDPDQLRNLASPQQRPIAPNEPLLLKRQKFEVIDRLDALLLVLKSCKGTTCIDPWRVLHPRGDVDSLSVALKPKFDRFYQAQPKVSFTKCEMGYLVESEGPQIASIYGGATFGSPQTGLGSQRVIGRSENGDQYYGKSRWSDWT
ncbi:Alkaline phosphatase-like protein [Glarea lozoyensis ATCC 20868]|uniref:Arylsulfatase n=1 Tax=Glarea lozoyensis (strain ATCC 20868 / MF5171) TaxID=1116229 RepID=S3DBA1_GLAL2|nr:Alkaline phosphatase-like protein [Glarea lozoyensis ATCC 20868]EPE35025.1 Alkaline phosphatase-like protein [Glarea lozoyensis ATCC 20868]